MAGWSFWSSIARPPTRPKFGCNPSHSGSTHSDVTGFSEEAPAFFRDQVSEPLCVCHELVGAVQVVFSDADP